MNTVENLGGSSRMAARVARVMVSRSLEIRSGEEPTRILYALLFSPAAYKLGIQRGSVEEKNAKKVVSAIGKSWIKADAMLDRDAMYSGIDPVRLAQEREAALNAQLILDESIPANMRQEVGEMEMAARKRAYQAHTGFMATFDPGTSTFEDVMGYRANTTGLMVETIVNAMHIVSGNRGDIDPLRKSVVHECLCLQMCDDLVDCVSDYRKGLPNLFYALSLENPLEKGRFESASMNQAIIDTRRPYDIAQFYAPNTLLVYMQRFQAMSSLLPSGRRQFAQDSMAAMTHLSFSPNTTTGTLNLPVIGQMLSRRTRIE